MNPVMSELSIYETVQQSWLIHPVWTPDDHLQFIRSEGRSTQHLTPSSRGFSTVQELIASWLTDFRKQAHRDAEVQALKDAVRELAHMADHLIDSLTDQEARSKPVSAILIEALRNKVGYYSTFAR